MALRLTVFAALAVAALSQPDPTQDAVAPTPAPPPTTTAAPTPSPLDKYKSSVKVATAAMAKLESAVSDLKGAVDDQERIDADGYEILKSTGGDKHEIRDLENQKIDEVKSLADSAKGAAADMGSRASDVEAARKTAGGNSSLYEPEYEKRSIASKQMSDHADDLSDQAVGNIKDMFDKITRQIKEAEKGAKEARKEQAKQEEIHMEKIVYQKQAKANAIKAAEEAEAKAKAEAAAAAARAQADAEAAKSEQIAQEAAAKEAAAEAIRAQKLAEAAAKDAEAKRKAAAAAAAANAPADTPAPAVRGTALAATSQDTPAGVIMLGVLVGLTSMAAGVRAYRQRPTPEINTYSMLG